LIVGSRSDDRLLLADSSRRLGAGQDADALIMIGWFC
jgi:hypothetical protein